VHSLLHPRQRLKAAAQTAKAPAEKTQGDAAAADTDTWQVVSRRGRKVKGESSSIKACTEETQEATGSASGKTQSTDISDDTQSVPIVTPSEEQAPPAGNPVPPLVETLPPAEALSEQEAPAKKNEEAAWTLVADRRRRRAAV
jgi:hypothetical protein